MDGSILEAVKVKQGAIRRVTNPLPAPRVCRYCGSGVALVNNSQIYGRSFGTWPFAYLCQNRRRCRAYVGVHPYTTIPLGTLADAELREARKSEKCYFDLLWRPGRHAVFATRSEAYSWLADKLRIPAASCHWAWFDVETCRRAGEICRKEIALGLKIAVG